MANLILPHRWQNQPTGPVEIDWNADITRGLKLALLGSTGIPINLVNHRVMTLTDGTIGQTHTPQGVAFAWNRATTRRIDTGIVNNNLRKHSLFVLARHDELAFGTSETHISTRGASNTGFGARTISPIGSAPNTTYLYNYVHGGVQNLDSTVPVEKSHWSAAPVGWSADTQSGGVVRHFGNGKFSNQVSVTSNMTQNSTSVVIGTDSGTASPLGGDIPLMLYWQERFLSDDEQISLALNPWQVFRPLKRRLFFFSGGAVIVEGTLSGTFGALTSNITGDAGATGTLAGTFGSINSNILGDVPDALVYGYPVSAGMMQSTRLRG